MNLSLSGLSNVSNAINAIQGLAELAVMQRLNEGAQNIYQQADADVPVLSGDLKDSGRVEFPSATDVDVTYGYEPGYNQYGLEDGYAWFVEEGHLTVNGDFVPAQPYLDPAFQSEVQSIQDDLA